mgnify:FL=1
MEKIKPFINQCLESEKRKDVLVVIIVILVGLGSFGLGRLSKNQNSGLRIEYENQRANVIDSISGGFLDANLNSNISQNLPKTSSGSFFASNRGSKYYSIGCSGGKTIKQENRIYFNTQEEVETAGYELSSSCE